MRAAVGVGAAAVFARVAADATGPIDVDAAVKGASGATVSSSAESTAALLAARAAATVAASFLSIK